MLYSMNDIEVKTVILKGLDSRKHTQDLNILEQKGWILANSSPDTKNMSCHYKLKRRVKKQDMIPA